MPAKQAIPYTTFTTMTLYTSSETAIVELYTQVLRLVNDQNNTHEKQL